MTEFSCLDSINVIVDSKQTTSILCYNAIQPNQILCFLRKRQLCSLNIRNDVSDRRCFEREKYTPSDKNQNQTRRKRWW